MKVLLLAVALGATFSSPTHAAWDYPWDVYAQARQERHGRGQDRAQSGRDTRPDHRPQRDQRRERLSDDERRALHRDLDKANRELYQRRNQR